jgi:hypothetical protein
MPSREELRAFEAACPTSQMRDIAMRDNRAPTGRPGVLPNTAAPLAAARSIGRSDHLPPSEAQHPVPGVSLLDRQLSPFDRFAPAQKPETK